MMIKESYEIVENALSKFPVEYSKNYYDNKKDIIIHYKKEDDQLGILYSYKDNEISVYKEEDLIKALFYMAFRNRENISKKVLLDIGLDVDILCDNGVAYRKGNNIRNKGLTQGFADYLTNICTNKQPSTINGYFVDLLISIYGEDILMYPLLNDPLGFYLDVRFTDIIKFCDQLDIYNDCKMNMLIVSNYRDEYIEILNNEKRSTIEKMYALFEKTINEYRTSIVCLFECIINEYKNYGSVNIDVNTFIGKLEEFISNPSFLVAFGYDNEEYSVKEHITQLIASFKEEKKHFEQNPQYVKKEDKK